MRKKVFMRLFAVVLATAMVIGQPLISVSADTIDDVLIEETSESILISEDEPVSAEISEENEAGQSIFRGMPEEYRLSEAQLDKKRQLREYDVAGMLGDMEEGTDYVAGEILYSADSEEEARLIAQAYNAQLTEYIEVAKLATAELPEGVSVYDAIIAASGDNLMPPVSPDYITRMEEPVIINEDDEWGSESELLPDNYTVPEKGDYNAWVQGVNGSKPLLAKPDKYLKNPYDSDYQWFHEMIGTYGAWPVTMGRSSIKVAVIDCGVQADHPDLKDRVTQIKVESIAAAPASGQYHGTHVAGIIAASAGNEAGGAGVAPGVSIVSLNIFGSSNTYLTKDLVSAIDLAAANNVDIINMSLSGFGYAPELQEAVNNAYSKGITVIAAMGNNGNNYMAIPASMNHVIAVASVNKDGTLSQFSNYGKWADIAAPGSNIMSTYIGNDYRILSGTSMASPIVSGVAALYMSRYGNPGPRAMEDILKKSAVKVGSSEAGKGIVNASNMFSADEAEPVFVVTDSKGTVITDLKKSVPAGSRLVITKNTSGSGDTIVYTTDGSKPAFKDGELVNGNVYSSAISLDGFPSASTIVINAQVVTGNGKIGKTVQFNVTAPDKSAQASAKVKTVKLNADAVELAYKNGDPAAAVIAVEELIDINGSKASLSSYKYEWISSDANVVKADKLSDGSVRITAAGKGNAKVTLKILDGSNKSASVNVSVIRLADSITITGQTVIEPGQSCTYKANILPADINNKKISWKISGDIPDGVSISTSGKVSVTGTAKTGASFTVLAVAEDGSNAYGSMVVKIRNRVKNISISAGGDSRAETDKNGKLAAVRVFTCNISTLSGDNDRITLKVLDDEGREFTDAIWSSSNSKIAVISGNDKGSSVVVRGIKPGTAKINVIANDGSGKKASVKVNVIVPASGLTLLPNDYSYNTIIAGKSAKATAVLGNAYGDPGIKAVNWSFKISGKCPVLYQTSDGTSYAVGYDDKNARDVTNVLKDAVKISKDGKIKIDAGKWEKGMLSLGYYDRKNKVGPAMKLTVTAKTTDGTGYSDTADYYVNFKPVFFGIWDVGSTKSGFYFVLVSTGYYGPMNLKISKPEYFGARYGFCTHEYWSELEADLYFYYIYVDSKVSNAKYLKGLNVTCKPMDGGFSYKFVP